MPVGTQGTVKAMRHCPQPIVSAVEGVCAGAGAIQFVPQIQPQVARLEHGGALVAPAALQRIER